MNVLTHLTYRLAMVVHAKKERLPSLLLRSGWGWLLHAESGIGLAPSASLEELAPTKIASLLLYLGYFEPPPSFQVSYS